ncbi:MAG: DNA-binding protein [Magnetococcales bacterium]|nr:DNA-binding protein [Magnetococcales bacterium]
MREFTPGRCWLGRLPHDGDLLAELNAFCRTHGIQVGRIEGVGAVKRACLGFYDQTRHAYDYLTYEEPLEIVQMVGNVSLKEDKPFVHVHITLSDHTGRAFGGHLAPGTILFAAEVLIQALHGDPPRRGFDPTTGLPLWVEE